VIRLDRNVTPQTPLPFRRTNALALNSAIYVIGYPSGLPEKIAAGARILASNRDFFTANLDTFGGNSGSPVFDAASDAVVGVLVRGATDYVRRGNCWVANVLPNSSGSEESTRTNRIAPFIPLGG
jgi:V8-like Glu-specific endopeptidase